MTFRYLLVQNVNDRLVVAEKHNAISCPLGAPGETTGKVNWVQLLPYYGNAGFFINIKEGRRNVQPRAMTRHANWRTPIRD